MFLEEPIFHFLRMFLRKSIPGNIRFLLHALAKEE